MNFHVCQDIRDALWHRCFGDFQYDDGRPMRPLEAFNALCDELAKGHTVLPVPECDHFDPRVGCLGHGEKTRIEDGGLRIASELPAPPSSTLDSPSSFQPTELGAS
jgi:hypothetical protein